MTDIVAALVALGIDHEVHRHPPVLTVEEAREHWASIDATHTKNLLLKDAAGTFWLVCMPAESPLDLKALPDKIGAKRLRFAPAEQLPSLLGVEAGAVSAFAMVNDSAGRVRLVLDAALMAADRVAFHPLDNRRTIVLTPEGLKAYLASIGKDPTVAAL